MSSPLSVVAGPDELVDSSPAGDALSRKRVRVVFRVGVPVLVALDAIVVALSPYYWPAPNPVPLPPQLFLALPIAFGSIFVFLSLSASMRSRAVSIRLTGAGLSVRFVDGRTISPGWDDRRFVLYLISLSESRPQPPESHGVIRGRPPYFYSLYVREGGIAYVLDAAKASGLNVRESVTGSGRNAARVFMVRGPPVHP